LKVWNQGKFVGTLKKFYSEVRRRMSAQQTPNWFNLGGTAVPPLATSAPFALSKSRRFVEEE
jgi:hypothetical protein